MKTKQGEVSTKEDMELRERDRGEIKGRFEIHFGAVLEFEVVIDQRTCAKFERIATRYATKKGLEKTDISPRLDTLFDKHFRVKLRKKEHITLEDWETWQNLFQLYLDQIALKRSMK